MMYGDKQRYGIDLGDFQIRADVRSFRSMKPVYYISTSHDPSVGIFGLEISPSFRKISRLKEFWKRYGDQITALYYDDKIQSTEEFVRRVHKITRGWS